MTPPQAQTEDTIIHGDCVDVMRTLPDASVDLVFADPPYNLQLDGDLLRADGTTVVSVTDAWDQFAYRAAYDAFARRWLTEARRVLRDEGALWVIGSYHNIFRIGTLLMDMGFWLLSQVTWVKTNAMPNFQGKRFKNATETLIWAAKDADVRVTFNYQALKRLNGDTQMSNVWPIAVCRGHERLLIDGHKAHPTQKPEALLYRVLLATTDPGDVVLDPFFGTGTTGAVARKLGRHFIGIERDAQYVQLARQRLGAIPPAAAPQTLLETPSRRKQPRVAMGQLLAANYLYIGQPLYSADRQQRVVVQADGHVRGDGDSGSIHTMAARCQDRRTANGWDYWHIETPRRDLVPLDTLRQRYRADHDL